MRRGGAKQRDTSRGFCREARLAVRAASASAGTARSDALPGGKPGEPLVLEDSAKSETRRLRGLVDRTCQRAGQILVASAALLHRDGKGRHASDE